MKITITITGKDKEQLHLEANAIIEHMRDKGYIYVRGGKNAVTVRGDEKYILIEFKAIKGGK